MNNIEYKRVIISEEIKVRDYLISFLQQEFSYVAQRKSIRFNNGIISVGLPPLIKKRLLSLQEKVVDGLKKEGVNILKIV